MLFVSFGYALIILLTLIFEWVRINKTGPDLLSLFLMLLFLQAVIPGGVITAAIGLYGNNISTGNVFYDKVLDSVSVIQTSIVMLMTACFLVFLYVTWGSVFCKFPPSRQNEYRLHFYVSPRRLVLVMLLGLIGMWILLISFGGGHEGYINLIRFRAGSPMIERNFINANLFTLTQTFVFISVIGLVVFLSKRIISGILFSIICMLIFVIMSGSRRAFLLPLLFLYFTFVIRNRRFYFIKFIIPITIVSLPVIMYGKKILAMAAFGSKFQAIDPNVSGTLRVVMNIGISTVESWATLLYLHIPLRLGIDQVLSVARRIPDGLLGIDIDFPERIVRISTTAFLGQQWQDIPPGLIGQMWLDFRVFGAVLWGIFFGLQVGLLQVLYNKGTKSIGAVAVFVIMLFIVALPINSGSLDFTFSIDIFALIFFIILIFRVKKYSIYK